LNYGSCLVSAALGAGAVVDIEAFHPVQVLYNFLGTVEVLQPATGTAFTLEDEDHCMLPKGAALFKLAEPTLTSQSSAGSAAGSATEVAELQKGAHGSRGEELTLGDAVLAFMNCPHPLQTLGDVRSYGASGSISRFHNPKNYSTALFALL